MLIKGHIMASKSGANTMDHPIKLPDKLILMSIEMA